VKGKTGRVNASEPPLMSRNREPRKVGCGSGVQDQPLERGRRWPTDPTPAREHRRSRDIGGAHPGRVWLVRNTTTPLGPGTVTCPCADRKEGGSPSGHRMAQEAKAGGRKAAGNRDDVVSSSADRPG
jgi:hypothetical protein